MTDISGPTLEISITTTQLIRAGDLWSILQQASEAGDVRVKVDWNGINARAWDQSFVPWQRPEHEL
jgi:hypothetical protein